MFAKYEWTSPVEVVVPLLMTVPSIPPGPGTKAVPTFPISANASPWKMSLERFTLLNRAGCCFCMALILVSKYGQF